MRLVRPFRDIPADALGAVAALGNFDGVHLGHRALIGEAAKIARDTGRPLAAIVFEPYPREFFRPQDEPFRLTTLAMKARLLEAIGVEFVIVIDFDAALAAMLAQDFVLHVLVETLQISHLVIGEDFQFGKGRGGDATVLAYMGEMEGFGVTVFAPVTGSGETKVSSSDIRTELKRGYTAEAAWLLGSWWSVEGEVIHGDQRGRELGFPTANLRLDPLLLRPAFGVYAVRVRIHGEDGPPIGGVANFGLRPMFQLKEPLLEVHLFDFSGDLYGRTIAVEFLTYMRGELNFPDLDALKKHMEVDAAAARAVLALQN